MFFNHFSNIYYKTNKSNINTSKAFYIYFLNIILFIICIFKFDLKSKLIFYTFSSYFYDNHNFAPILQYLHFE